MGKLTINGNFQLPVFLTFGYCNYPFFIPRSPREIPRVSHTSLKRWPGRYAPDEPEKKSASWGRGSQLSELGIQQWTKDMTLFDVCIYIYIYSIFLIFLIYIYATIQNYWQYWEKRSRIVWDTCFRNAKKPSITITNCDTKFHVYPHEAFGQWRRVVGGFSIPLSQNMVERLHTFGFATVFYWNHGPWPIEIVGLPIQDGDFPVCDASLC